MSNAQSKLAEEIVLTAEDAHQIVASGVDADGSPVYSVRINVDIYGLNTSLSIMKSVLGFTVDMSAPEFDKQNLKNIAGNYLEKELRKHYYGFSYIAMGFVNYTSPIGNGKFNITVSDNPTPQMTRLMTELYNKAIDLQNDKIMAKTTRRLAGKAKSNEVKWC